MSELVGRRQLGSTTWRVACFLAAGAVFGNPGETATLYVSATAPTNGRGSLQRPFESLASVEAASSPGDTIVVLPSPLNVAPLDGGIALKANQHLIGGGPRIAGAAARTKAARIANTNAARLSGDAVRLADNTEVENLVIVNAYRGGIYGLNISSSKIHGNDVSAVDTSCVEGFLIYSSDGSASLKNAWAAIMVDANKDQSTLWIHNNFVHDSTCGDGIDIRASGTALVTAHVDRNEISRLKQGSTVGSVLAIGMQTRDSATLVAESSDNSELAIGNMLVTRAEGDSLGNTRGPSNPWPAGDLDGADCEGVFSNQTGGTLLWDISDNKFEHGVGGTSCNGAEFYVSSGHATLVANIRHSTFDDNPGDMIEENNLGTGSVMSVTLDDVHVHHTTLQRARPPEVLIPPLAIAAMTSGAFCISQNAFGPQSISIIRAMNSSFEDCAGDAINSAIATLPSLFGTKHNGLESSKADIALVSIEIENSTIAHTAGYGLHVVNYAPLGQLQLKVEGSHIETNSDTAAFGIAQAPGAATEVASIDLGGGDLNSSGLNCLINSSSTSVETFGYEVTAKNNWWGNSGASPGLFVSSSLADPPPACR